MEIVCEKQRWGGGTGRGTCANSLRKVARGMSATAWCMEKKEGAHQHGARIGKCANSLQKVSLGRSVAPWWTDRKPCK